MQVEPLADKYASFGWKVMRADGHDMAAIVDAFDGAHAVEGKPVVILADTVKGKGGSFMENQPDWHGSRSFHFRMRKLQMMSGPAWFWGDGGQANASTPA